MVKIGQNWAKIANYPPPPQCSTKIFTPAFDIGYRQFFAFCVNYRYRFVFAFKRHQLPNDQT